jgi:hypothetical protein
MPTPRDLFSQIKTIQYTSSHFKVEHTVASELRSTLAPQAEVRLAPQLESPAGTARIAVVDDSTKWKSIHAALDQKRDWMMLRVKPGSGIELLVSRPHLLYGFFCWIQNEWLSRDAAEFANGKILHPTFSSMRPLYDLFLIQHARTVRNFNREEYFKTLVRSGFSHAEVNALAFAVPIETGPKGEVYPRFYTYCPALDQFVASRLNKGIYPDDYLQANLNNLKTNVELAERYGLASGLLCFEPRSVPEQLIQRYPMLRGARVDHPLRSFQPRYNLSVAHPVVREHYAEMMENLIKEVPTLDYISIWSNDSGAGFEYTSSLYVGRNGGGYVIREWTGDKEIAEAAAHNLVRFLRVLRDAGRKVNPKFRSLIRLEPFTAEHDYIWQQLEDGVDVEVSSLQTKGWGLFYKHPKYAEVPEIHGMNVYSRFDPKEKPLMQELQQRGSQTDVVFTPGILWNHEPLIGIPFPYLVYEKLNDMAAQEVKTVCALGGATPLAFAPYNINQELVRAFQMDRQLDLSAFLQHQAATWVGENLAGDLVKVWRHVDEAWRSFPVPIWIYAAWSVWYRLFVRPIIPNIEAISEADRAYYEKFLLATSHNRCRVDFRYDVGFDLLEPWRAALAVKHIDDDLFPEMNAAIALLEQMRTRATSTAAQACLTDHYDRLRALRCWFRTQRNVTAWIAGVHGFLESSDEKTRRDCKAQLRQMVLDEIENTKDLLQLWEASTTNWMIISEVGETTLIYYKNFGELLKRKIALMTGHENDDPYVDPDFQWRVPGFTV